MRLDTINLSPEITLLAAVIVGVIGSARVTRLVTGDTFPPSVRLRMWWEKVTKDGPYSVLMQCPWCFAPWVVLLNGAAAVLSDLHPAWWIVNGWMAASYAASWIVFHDED